MNITIEVIKKFIEKEVGFEIEHKNGKYTKGRNDKVFSRWFLTYMSYKYSEEFVTNEKIGRYLNLKPCTVLYGIAQFEHLMIYDKQQSKNFKLLEDLFVKKFNPKIKEVLDVLDSDKLKLLKDIKNSSIKTKQDKIKIKKLERKIERLKKAS